MGDEYPRGFVIEFPLSSGNMPVFPDRSAKLWVLSVKSAIYPDKVDVSDILPVDSWFSL